MPRELCFATLLVFSLLLGEGLAQQFASSNFGREIATEVSSDGAPSVRGETQFAPSNDPSHLVRPPLDQTPDRYVRSVQQAGYSQPIEEALSDGNPASPPEAVPTDHSSEAARSAATTGRDLGFPSLDPPGKPRMGGAGTAPSTQGLGSVVTVISSLAVVLGLFFMTAWLMRRTAPGGLATLPEDVFVVLGRAQLNHRQQVHLVRCGTKLLLISLTPDSAETLTEIDDPDEVARLAGLCRTHQAGSASAAFRQVLHQFAGQPAEPGFIGRTDSRTTRAASPSELENLHG